MTTLYLDFENGDNNYAGTSFALLAQGTDGRITTATFSSATATFPNDGSLIGQYLSIFNGSIYAVYNITAWVSATSLTIAALSGGTSLANQAVDRQYYIGGRWKNITTGATAVRTIPGDEIRIMGSPAPTSLGQTAVWTSQALQGTKTLTAATNATPIAITIAGHGYSTGDTVVVTGVGGNTAANGTWEITVTAANTFTLDGSAGNGNRTSGGTVRLRNNTRVKLTTAVTQNIASTGPGRAAWTSAGGANVVTALNTTTTKEHFQADNITLQAGFTTGLATYWPTGMLDLSSYQQVSFWIQIATGSLGAAGQLDLRLCSDTAGVAAVNIISVPALAATGRWMPVTVDLCTNLGSSIQSIALYVNTDVGLQVIRISNIIACKASSAADSLTLTSLIGKNTTDETFWGIQSINGTRVMLDANNNATPTSTTVRGYYGTSETVTTWKRETIKLGPAAATTTALQTIQESGTDGSPITYSGGWDRTNMSTQTLETWLDGLNGNGYGISFGSSWLRFDQFMAGVRFDRFLNGSTTQGTGLDCSFVAANNNTGNPAVSISQAGTVNALALCANASAPYGCGGVGNQIVNLGKVYSNNSTMNAFAQSRYSTFTLESYNTGSHGLSFRSPDGVKVKNSKFGANSTNVSTEFATNSGTVYFYNCLFSDSTEVQFSTNGTEAFLYSQDHDQTAGNHKVFSHGYLISSATDQRKTASGISWKIQPTNVTSWNSSRPIQFSLAKVACAANSAVTIKAWMRRNNSGLTMRLVCKGGQIAGVASDVVSALTTTNDWEEETITFTHTETGVVEITAEAWGGTTYSGWVDDMTISQV